MAGNAVNVGIGGDTKQLVQALQQGKGILQGFADHVKNLFARQSSDGLEKALAPITAEKGLVIALRSLGDEAHTTKEAVLAFSDQIAKMTSYTKDAATEVQTLFIRMGQLSPDQIHTATLATLDLAAALGVDAVEAAGMLADRLGSPVALMALFEKANVGVSAAVRAQVTALADQGRILDANSILFKHFEDTIGGLAQVVRYTRTPWESFVEHISESFGRITAAGGRMWTAIQQNTFDPMINFIHNAIGPALDGLAERFETTASVIELVMPLAFDTFKDAMAAWLGEVKTMYENFSTYAVLAGLKTAQAFADMILSLGNTLADWHVPGFTKQEESLESSFRKVIIADLSKQLTDKANWNSALYRAALDEVTNIPKARRELTTEQRLRARGKTGDAPAINDKPGAGGGIEGLVELNQRIAASAAGGENPMVKAVNAQGGKNLAALGDVRGAVNQVAVNTNHVETAIKNLNDKLLEATALA